MASPLLYETHTHTPLCKHAVGQPEEYAAVALTRGLRGLIVTCHNPMPDGFSSRVRMSVDQFDEYVDLVARARDEYAGRIDVRMGLEADYFEGYERWLESQLASADFHYVLGSVHPYSAQYKERYWSNDLVDVQRTYFDLLAKAAETGLFDSLSHPDLIKNETADEWDPPRIIGEICSALDRIAATGIAMELNTSGMNKVVPEMNPFPEMLAAMQERQISVVIGSDAHVPERVGDRFDVALDLLAECGFSHISHFVGRIREDVPIELAKQNLRCP